MKKILKNAARCNRCGEIIESKTVHDFVECGCGSLSVDGGREYIRRVFAQGITSNDYEDLSEYEEACPVKGGEK